MKQNELEAAISAGIFWGVIGVLTLIFVLWLFSPLLIPLAFAAQIYVIEQWQDLLVILSIGAIMGMVILGLWFWLVNSSLAIWFEKRDSGNSDSRGLLLFFGLFAAIAFVVFSFISRNMVRDFLFKDGLFLLGLFCFSIVSLYFAFRRSKGRVKTP